MTRDWESCYRCGNIPWDKGTAAPPLQELGTELFGTGPVLVPGCGLGHDVRWLKDHGVAAVGLDVSATAIQQAQSLDRGAADDYLIGDFLDPGWQTGRKFTAIWEHTCFCAILPSQRSAYADSCARMLVQGEIFAGVFYLEPNRAENSDEPPFPTSIAEIDACFAESFERISGWNPSLVYPGREGREWIGVYRRKENSVVRAC